MTTKQHVFRLTPKQQQVARLIKQFPKNEAHFLLLYGGSQSAKTSFACAYIQAQCLQRPRTTAIIARQNFTDLKATIFQNTFQTMLDLQFGEGASNNEEIIKYERTSPLVANFFNGSKVYFLGLDESKVNDKILGRYANIFLIDEASEVSYKVFAKLQTRLNIKNAGRRLGICTMNPTTIFGWTYKMFIAKTNPVDDKPLANPEMFHSLQMNPADNVRNLPEGYLQMLENLSEHDRERFLHGHFGTTAQDAVYGEALNQAQKDGRTIGEIEIDPHYPVEIALDIGWDDFSAAWVFQIHPKRICFISYHEDNKIELAKFLMNVFQDTLVRGHNKWHPNTHVFLPHDASHTWVGNGMSIKDVLNKFSSMGPGSLFPCSYKVLELRGIYEGINAVRLLFPKLWFDERGCKNGLVRLANYVETYDDGSDAFKKETKHTIASHAADAMRYAISSFYFQHPFKQAFRKEKGKVYGWDLLDPITRRKLGLE
jgi:phage terminase large subunit